ncbi:MAG TPA: hypothetical protein VMH03_02215 [Terriglobales bacterium]|nr:hypothetical protein [Terriglobales bacterium]
MGIDSTIQNILGHRDGGNHAEMLHHRHPGAGRRRGKPVCAVIV